MAPMGDDESEAVNGEGKGLWGWDYIWAMNWLDCLNDGQIQQKRKNDERERKKAEVRKRLEEAGRMKKAKKVGGEEQMDMRQFTLIAHN
jgi:type VI protein secretion system component VasK